MTLDEPRQASPPANNLREPEPRARAPAPSIPELAKRAARPHSHVRSRSEVLQSALGPSLTPRWNHLRADGVFMGVREGRADR
jgi:hypothetical protein